MKKETAKLIQKMKSYKLLPLLLLALTISSCKKYLDVSPDSAFSSIKTAKDCQLLLNDYLSETE